MITRALSRGGTVVIPAFAIDRTEVVLHELAALRGDGTLPRHVPVYVDSPMALAALDVYRDAVRAHSWPRAAPPPPDPARPRNAVVIVGFAAAGTRSRDLVDGARTLKMFGEYISVRAEDGEETASETLRDRIDDELGWTAVVPKSGEAVLVR
ncbi:hypothetical protein [Streptomyces sp. NPDC002054]|uniref:hypothetical protein n=1 Tax=Streptomyces sp. NPDC002054 TaxID=3154663 RepID=UPI0033244CC3